RRGLPRAPPGRAERARRPDREAARRPVQRPGAIPPVRRRPRADLRLDKATAASSSPGGEAAASSMSSAQSQAAESYQALAPPSQAAESGFSQATAGFWVAESDQSKLALSHSPARAH